MTEVGGSYVRLEFAQMYREGSPIMSEERDYGIVLSMHSSALEASPDVPPS